MVREKRERQRGEGRSVKDDNAVKGERKTVTMITSVFRQSIAPQSHLLTHKIQMTTEDIDGGSVSWIIVMTIGEVSAGNLVHVAHRGDRPTTTTIADTQGQVRHLAQEKGGRRNGRKGSGTVIETVPAERRVAALQSQWIQRRKREEVIMDAEEAELQLNRHRRMIYLAFLR